MQKGFKLVLQGSFVFVVLKAENYPKDIILVESTKHILLYKFG